MLVETGMMLHFCQPGHLLTCSNFSSYVTMVAKKEYKLLDSFHKIRKARIHCFFHICTQTCFHKRMDSQIILMIVIQIFQDVTVCLQVNSH